MVPNLGARDVAGFKLLFSLVFMYAVMAALVYSVVHMKFITPLGPNAPLDRFSEARAVEHVRVLAEEIGGRQEGRPGLMEAALYIRAQLDALKERAGSNLRIEVEDTVVGGSFNMIFLGHSISLGYRNHTNILMRIASVDSQDTDPSVLINAHFDSPLASPGAGDCASCVGSLLELARLIIDSGWVPPRPIVFLFNGAEELFLLGAHGFATTHKWRDSLGAFINVEASGSAGPDFLCQSGPGSWPSLVYAQSAPYPMAHSAAQDVFPVIPGDTDYRIFSEDYGNIPALDIIYLFGGYYYHTSYDTVDRLLPGSMQARGENLASVLKAFVNSPKLQVANRLGTYTDGGYKDEKAVFFDYLTWFMVYYSRRSAVVLHSFPAVVFLLLPFVLHLLDPTTRSCSLTFWDFVKGGVHHAAGIILAILVPVLFSVVRLLFVHPMSWFAHSHLAFLMFIPCSLIGLLIPSTAWSCFPHYQNVSFRRSSKEGISDEARFWGAFGFYAFSSVAYLLAGLSGGFLTLILSAFMLPARISYNIAIKFYGRESFRSAACYIIPLIPSLLYCIYFGGLLAQFLIEKMGMIGGVPSPYGYYLADIIIAAVVGIVTGWSVGPLLPVCGRWLARSSILQFLVQFGVAALAISSQFFPYSKDAPKRLVFQHTFITIGGSQIIDSSYDFAYVDSNSLEFVFKYAPKVAEHLRIGSEISLNTANVSHHDTWTAIYPISRILATSFRFPAQSREILRRYKDFPHLSSRQPAAVTPNGGRRFYLELSLGSLDEVWAAVLNVTGPLSSWSFADGKLPAPEVAESSQPSYILRLSGSSKESWKFWLETNSTGDLRVDVAVLDQVLVDEAKKLKSMFPDWIDVVSYSSFISSHVL